MKDEKNLSEQSAEKLISDQKVESVEENHLMPEKKETIGEELITKEALRREIDLMELDESLKEEALQKAKKIQSLSEEEKIEHVLKIAQEKGIVFAVKVVKKMNDPYILDSFRDILVKEWATYKQFLK